MTTRLFAVDMDGTLLTDSDKSFDAQKMEEVLQYLSQQEGYFVVATGNQYPKSLDYLRDFRGRGLYFIAENGAYIADGEKDLLISGFSEQVVAQALEVLADFPEMGMVISTHQGAFIPADRAEIITSIVKENLDYMGADYPRDIDYLALINRFYPGAQTIDDYSQLQDTAVIKIALQSHSTETEALLGRLVQRLPRQIVPVQSGFGAIDLISRGVNKGSGLKWLCEKLGVPAEEVMAFGDASNDLEMLNFAEVGVAMGNATETVKAAADLVIGNNNEGAVLNHIAEVLKSQAA